MEQEFQDISEWGTAHLDLYTKRFNINALLRAYANWKQATLGDNKDPEPLRKDKSWYKWKAWKQLEGKSQSQAMADYIVIGKKFNFDLWLSNKGPDSVSGV